MPSFNGHASCEISSSAAPVTDAALTMNELCAALGADLRGKRVALWGLVPAGYAGRLCDSPTCAVVEALLSAGVAVSAYDPQWSDDAAAIFGGRVLLHDDPYWVAMEADALLLAGEPSAYRRARLDRLYAVMATPIIVDRSGSWAGLDLAGFAYWGARGRAGASASETKGASFVTVHA
jgi:UDPglucose 6-dehydrogenase